MRLRRLDLVRYGRFTDRSLDFGDAGTATDVTLVYGENEAGKSTAFAAWLDLLFGLPLQHAYDFVHARRELLVAAALETADGPLDLRRTGQRTGSLTDAAGRAIDESRLSRLLHGLDRDGYRTRFSLDDEVLRRGGEEIAQAKGELGQLLYAGATGLSGYAALLKEAEAEVDAFHKPRGRSTALAEAKTRLKEIDAALAEARLDPRRFEALRRDMDACDRACADADSLRDDARRSLALREAADARRTLRREMQEAEQTLATYPAGPDLPPDAPTQVRLAVEAAARAGAACAKAERRREAIADQLAGATPDAAGIEVGHMLETLEAARFDDGGSLIARAVAAAADMARRTAERDEARADARRMAVALAGAGADPAQLVLPKPVIAALREAAQDVRAAARSHADATVALAEAEADLGEPESMPDGADALADALDTFRALPFDLRDLARVADERATEARALAAGLPPAWRAMADAGLPTEAQIRVAERALTAANGRVEQAELRRREAVAARDARRAEYAAERQGAGVSDDTIAASRLDRDRLWAAHRAHLTAGTADAFEAAMREDDALRDRHAATVTARARLARIEIELATDDAAVARLEAAMAEAHAAREAPCAEMGDLALRLGLPEAADPSSLAERRQALHAALLAALQAEDAAQVRDAARATHRAALERVATAVAELGDSPPAGDIVATAGRLRAELDARRARIDGRGEAERLVRRLERQRDARAAALDRAQAAFDARLDGLWCANLTAEDVLGKVDGMADLADRYAAAIALDRRLGALQAALDTFDMRAAPLRAALSLDENSSVDAVLAAARRRAEAARETERAIARARQDEEALQTEIADQSRLGAEAETALANLFKGQAVAPGDDPVAAIRHLQERDALRVKRHDLATRHAALAEGWAPDALAHEERDEDPMRTAALRDALAEAETARDDALVRRGEARKALETAQGAAGGVDHAQDRAALLETLRAEAYRAAETRIGLMAAAGAMRRLREERRGSMLDATQAAFVRMTGGEWQRLETRPVGAHERLVGLRDGAAVGADAMSTGTRAQLYLALRVAGHADFVARNGPLPFVTDDVLETFDDTRARATLALMAEMGRRGQAIMFTHHRHLVALAQAEIPDLRVLELN